MTETEPLQTTALALICRPDTLNQQRLAGLSEGDWAQIINWGREHRFLPYLHYTLYKSGLLASLPTHAKETMSVAYRRSAMRALAVKADIIATHRALAESNIEHVFLKGAYLAEFSYPEPGLRPLRDIDVLVSKFNALEAYAALQAAGFTRDPQQQGKAETFVESSKHLPRLLSPFGRTALELHVQLTESKLYTDTRRHLRSQSVMTRAQTRSLANHAIRFPTPEDLLLHLCIHAVYEHQFDNGPLILSDLHWLLVNQSIDWRQVWAEAADQGVTRGLALALALLAREWPASREGWGCDLPSRIEMVPEIVTQASNLLLRSFAARSDVSILRNLDSTPSHMRKLVHLLARAFPARNEIAKQYPVSPSSPSILLYYPVLWRRLLSERLPQLIINLRSGERQSEARSISQIDAWLAKR